MEQNKKDQKFAPQPGKKAEMPQRNREDISSGPKTPRPEIDLPVQGGRSESDLASKNQPKRGNERGNDRDDQRDDDRRQDRNDYQKSTR